MNGNLPSISANSPAFWDRTGSASTTTREPYEMMLLLPDGRAIIKGTTDTAVARSLYARYVGS